MSDTEHTERETLQNASHLPEGPLTSANLTNAETISLISSLLDAKLDDKFSEF